MNHQIYKEWIPLAVDNELSEHEQVEFDKHLKLCIECQIEFDEQKKLNLFFKENNPEEPDEYFLFEARQGLRDAIRKERHKESIWRKLLGNLGFLSSKNFQAAFGGVAILLVGFFAGYLLFKSPSGVTPFVPSGGSDTGVETVSQTHDNPMDPQNFSLAQEDIRISNVRFIDQDASDGEIEFIFDAVKPVRMKGNINDERIKNVLTYSILNVDNPGVRLNSINAISSEERSEVDKEIKAALISVAKFDENPGVRRESIKLLSKFNSDADVKNTLLYVLANDEISGNRIEAINSLMKAQKEGTVFNEEELSVFKDKVKLDNNQYIRYQAKTVLSKNDPVVSGTENK